MQERETNARALLESLVGRAVETTRGRVNKVLGLDGKDVIVGTAQSPDGRPVPIAYIQDGLDRLNRHGELVLEPRSLNYRSSFVGAVLSQLPGASLEQTSPPRIRLTDPLDSYDGAGAATLYSRHSGLGTAYRESHPNSNPDGRQSFNVDPAIVERGLRGHCDTQNALAEALREAGLDPRSPLPPEPNFDLAWQTDVSVFVAEVKSITDQNEEEQLRLGLGQVLRYRQTLVSIGYRHVTAVLVAEHIPKDLTWRDLCSDLGVILLGGDEINTAPNLLEGI